MFFLFIEMGKFRDELVWKGKETKHPVTTLYFTEQNDARSEVFPPTLEQNLHPHINTRAGTLATRRHDFLRGRGGRVSA